MPSFGIRRSRAPAQAWADLTLRACVWGLLGLALIASSARAQEPVLSDDRSTPTSALGSMERLSTPKTESWLAQPISAGVFVGALQGSPLLTDWLGQNQGTIGGLRLGYDMGDHFGAELRYMFGSTDLFDTQRALAYRTLVDPNINQPGGGLQYKQTRHCDRDGIDLSLLWYLTGDTRCRFYVLTGIGLAEVRFNDVLDNRWSRAVPDIPLAIGVKYRCTEWTALRAELNDTIIFGNGAFNTLHDLSLTGGLEIRFGGSRRAYWPWAPATGGW